MTDKIRHFKIILDGIVTLSLNKFIRMHYKERWRLQQTYGWAIIADGAKQEKFQAEKGEARKVTITSYRKKLLYDSENLIGGCKPLVDALVDLDLLYDDSDKYCYISYRQEVAKDEDLRTEIEIQSMGVK